MNDSPKRVVARVMAREVMATMGQLADRYEMDLIDTLVFTAIWTANTAHLSDAEIYAGIFDVPPDRERRTVSLEAVAAALRIDRALVETRVEGLIGASMVALENGGLVVPSAVFTRPDMIDGVELTYVRTLRLVSTLDHYGVVAEVQRLARATRTKN
jgi:hypothetical protein